MFAIDGRVGLLDFLDFLGFLEPSPYNQWTGPIYVPSGRRSQLGFASRTTARFPETPHWLSCPAIVPGYRARLSMPERGFQHFRVFWVSFYSAFPWKRPSPGGQNPNLDLRRRRRLGVARPSPLIRELKKKTTNRTRRTRGIHGNNIEDIENSVKH